MEFRVYLVIQLQAAARCVRKKWALPRTSKALETSKIPVLGQKFCFFFTKRL